MVRAEAVKEKLVKFVLLGKLLYALNPSSLVERVRRFTNSRNKVGILSSHTQIMLSILTSISMLF
jgi:bifunctional pyridoxal-dependent enzyme with beta-cystathionase and maltose regulon repressor activities